MTRRFGPHGSRDPVGDVEQFAVASSVLTPDAAAERAEAMAEVRMALGLRPSEPFPSEYIDLQKIGKRLGVKAGGISPDELIANIAGEVRRRLGVQQGAA